MIAALVLAVLDRLHAHHQDPAPQDTFNAELIQWGRRDG